MIHDEWRAKIEFALHSPVEDLVVENIRVVGSLEGDLRAIQAGDIAALSEWGLPSSLALPLEPDIRPESTYFYLFGGTCYDLGQLDRRRVFARPQTGRVLDVTEENGVRYQYINTSIRQFAELAWRYHHVHPVLTAIADNWEELGPEPDEIARKMTWAKATEIDQLIDTDEAVSYWPARIFGLL